MISQNINATDLELPGQLDEQCNIKWGRGKHITSNSRDLLPTEEEQVCKMHNALYMKAYTQLLNIINK